jgi:hypothetical protein
LKVFRWRVPIFLRAERCAMFSSLKWIALMAVVFLRATPGWALADAGTACFCNSDCPGGQVCNETNNACQIQPAQCANDGECGCGYSCDGGICNGSGPIPQDTGSGYHASCPPGCGPSCSEYSLVGSAAGGCPQCKPSRLACWNVAPGSACRAPGLACFHDGTCGDCFAQTSCVDDKCCFPDGVNIAEISTEYQNKPPKDFCCSHEWKANKNGEPVCSPKSSCSTSGIDGELLLLVVGILWRGRRQGRRLGA